MQFGLDPGQFPGKLVVLPVAFACVIVLYLFRARAMRALAAKRGFHYVGPWAPKWFGLPKIKPRLPFARNWYPADEIRQVWNVIEGERDGVPILIFDSVFGPFGWNTYTFCTFIACEAEENPFEIDSPSEATVESRGWRVVYRLSGPFIVWSMSIKRLERHLESVKRPVCEGALSALSRSLVKSDQR